MLASQYFFQFIFVKIVKFYIKFEFDAPEIHSSKFHMLITNFFIWKSLNLVTKKMSDFKNKFDTFNYKITILFNSIFEKILCFFLLFIYQSKLVRAVSPQQAAPLRYPPTSLPSRAWIAPKIVPLPLFEPPRAGVAV